MKTWLTYLLLIAPCWVFSQAQPLPFQLEWVNSPFAGKLQGVSQLTMYMWGFNGRKGEFFKDFDQFTIQLDSLGRSVNERWRYHLGKEIVNQSTDWSYDSQGCPLLANHQYDSTRWMRVPIIPFKGCHCVEGRIDTIGLFVLEYDVNGRLVKEVFSPNDTMCRQVVDFIYDEKGRLAMVDGKDSVSFQYVGDSILIDQYESDGIHILSVFSIGPQGLPLSCENFEFRGRSHRKRLYRRVTYSYVMR